MKGGVFSRVIEIEEVGRLLEELENKEEDMFREHLCASVAKKIGATSIKMKRIADDCGFAQSHLQQFPLKNRKILVKILKHYQFTIKEAADFYDTWGLRLSMCNPYDKEYISELYPTVVTELPEYVNTIPFRDMLLILIAEQEYPMQKSVFFDELSVIKEELLKNKIDEIGEERKAEYIDRILKLVSKEARSYQWVIESGFKGEMTDRNCLFEIAYICGFDLKATERLFNSYGMTLSPDSLREDVVYFHLLTAERPKRSKRVGAALYKELTSDLFSPNQRWKFIRPTKEMYDKASGKLDLESIVRKALAEPQIEEEPIS